MKNTNESFRMLVKAVPAVLIFLLVFSGALNAARYMENLNRGVVAVRVNASSVYIGWRMLGTDPSSISFNVYRDSTKLNATPITTSTNYTDNTTATGTYTVRPVIGGVEQAPSESASVWPQFYMTIPMSPPGMATMPDGVTCTYNANDCSTGDLDGDGQYEIIVKWDPTNSKDNSQSGYTGDVFLDAYKLNGTRLWRIDLGINIRAGAHYTQFMVYDLDSDGKAEVACKTAPGTKDSSGGYLGTGPAASDNDASDYRTTGGYILSGPEYLTVFNGQTGREISTIYYNPRRHPSTENPSGTQLNAIWGDNYGNRVDRFLACIAYLDGVHPSLVMCRGYYTRSVLVAYDWNGSTLTQRWIFDAALGSANAGQGNHNLSVGDVDSDGKDEIIYGAMAIDDNGALLYNTGLGHGDAGHLGNMDPDRAGLENFQPHEEYPQAAGAEYRDARTGALLWGYASTADVGRGMAGDIDANYRGWEFWASNTDGVYNVNGTRISTTKPSVNFRIYWDGDLQDELLDGTKLDKWNGAGTTRLVTIYNYATATENNGTKANPGLTADILGDWREEMIYRSSNSNNLIIFTTTTTTTYRFYTLMHDFMYRLAVAWQNVAYNQPPHVSFYLGDGPPAQPVESIILAGAGTPTPVLTPTRTPTRTRTPSFTPSRTTTISFTATRTATLVVPTATFSATRTSTASASMTISASPSSSFTRTPTVVVPTLTFTATGTPTHTRTATGTYTRTSTYTRTGTPTQTRTATLVPSLTATPSITISASPTGTRTSTLIITMTSTAVLTQTSTPADTKTNTAVPTATRTRTSTPTITATWSPTLTSTRTPAPTSTGTVIPTLTGTSVPTGSSTPVPSVTTSVSPENTITRTPTTIFSATRTSTMAISATSTATRTATPTRTATTTRTETTVPSPIATVTATRTSSSVPTSTSSSSSTPTATPTATYTMTPSLTVTNTFTSTFSATRSVTFTYTITRTYTPTYTHTATFTPTDIPTLAPTDISTFTPTLASTEAPTPVDTATLTPTVPPAVFTITDPVIYPNPYNPSSGSLKVRFTLSRDAVQARFRLYTPAFRYILKWQQSGSFSGTTEIAVDSSRLSSLASGTYYYIITARTSSGAEASAKIQPVIIIR